jgi:thiosulfate/3-mercaptopyruvate sulfurtransferase
MMESFISTDALASELGRPGLVILDTRPMMGFLMSHIPGALNVDWKAFSDQRAASKGILHPDRSVLEQKIGALGIGNESRVVCYADPVNGYGEDGRLYWMLSYLGHANVSILDGGWAKWQREKRPIERGPAKPPQPAHFAVATRPEVLIEREELKRRLAAREGMAIIDARSPGEYQRQGMGGRGGHVPGAVNIPWNGFYNADGSIQAPEAITEALAKQGVEGKGEYVVYCAAGVRCSWLFALMSRAGIKNVRNYVGSWSDWSSDPNAPIEK